MAKKKSIYDLAQELGVSATTLSFVLNGKAKEKRISEELIQKIETYIKETGFRPSHFGRSLSTGKSKTIGIIVADIANPFFSEIASIVEKETLAHGYTLLMVSSNNSIEQMNEAIEILKERNVDGYLISPIDGVEEPINGLLAEHKKVVLYNSYLPNCDVFAVVTNNFQLVYEAATLLYKNGYRKIGFIGLNFKVSNAGERLAGYEKFVSEAGLEPTTFLINYQLDFPHLITLIQEFLRQNPQIDSLIFSTNYITMSAIKAIHNLGGHYLDLGLVSFDDHLLYQFTSPSVTAIRQPTELISKTAIQTLFKMLNNEEVPPITVTLPSEIIERGSTTKK